MGKKKSGYVAQPSPLRTERKPPPPPDWPAKPAPVPAPKKRAPPSTPLPLAPAVLVAITLAFVYWAWAVVCPACGWADVTSGTEPVFLFAMELARIVALFYAPLHPVAQNADNLRALSLHHIRDFILSASGVQLIVFFTRLDVFAFRALRSMAHGTM